MLTISNNLKRSWQILWNYKLLWIFAVLGVLAMGIPGDLTTPYGYSKAIGYFVNLPTQWVYWATYVPFLSGDFLSTPLMTSAAQTQWMISSFVTMMSLWIGLSLVFAFVRYPVETTLIRMVDEHAASGAKVSFKQGWKLGWSRRSLRLWLIDMIFAVPVLVYWFFYTRAMLGFMQAFESGQAEVIAAQSISFLVLEIVTVYLYVLSSAFLGVIRELVARAAVLENTGVLKSFTRGWVVFKRNAGKVLLLGALLFSIGTGVGIPMVIAMFVLIPLYAIMAIPGAIVAAIPAGITYGLATLFGAQSSAGVAAAIAGGPILAVIIFLPLALLSGLAQLFFSSNWTLAYRQLIGETPPMLPVTPPAAEPPAEPAQ